MTDRLEAQAVCRQRSDPPAKRRALDFCAAARPDEEATPPPQLASRPRATGIFPHSREEGLFG